MPVFNGGPFIARALESVVNQTYENLEVIVMDNASLDDTREIVKRYIRKDKRIKYFRQEETVGAFENFFGSLKHATGEFCQLLACDDWLSRNHVENVMGEFQRHPAAAAVFFKYLSFKTEDNEIFKFDDIGTMKPGSYSRDYYFRNLYRSYIGAFSIYSVLRTKDAIRACRFTHELFSNPPKDISEGFRRLAQAAYGIDIVMFLKIIPDYEYFVFTDKSAYIKVKHSRNYSRSSSDYLNITMDNAVGILNNYDFFRTCHEFLYKNNFPSYLQGLRVHVAAQALNTLIINLIKNASAGNYFSGFGFKNVKIFFRDATFGELALIALKIIPDFISRLFMFIIRKVGKKSAINSRNNKNIFLDKQGRFRV